MAERAHQILDANEAPRSSGEEPHDDGCEREPASTPRTDDESDSDASEPEVPDDFRSGETELPLPLPADPGAVTPGSGEVELEPSAPLSSGETRAEAFVELGVERDGDSSVPAESCEESVSGSPGSCPDSRDAARELGVEVLDLIVRRAHFRSYRVRRFGDGAVLQLTVLDRATSESERERFWRGALTMMALGRRDDVQRVHEISPTNTAYLADCPDIGSAEHFGVLQLPLMRRLDFFLRVAEAVATLHALETVHGCLSPQNILLDDAFRPVLSEVGLIDVAEALRGDRSNRWGYGAYAAPEVRSRGGATKASDVYSLGRLLHFVVFDEPPGLTVRTHAAGIPPRILRAIHMATQHDPMRRYATVRALVDDLRTKTVDGESMRPSSGDDAWDAASSRRSLRPERAKEAQGEGTHWAAVLTTVVAIGLAVGLWLLVRGSSPDEKPLAPHVGAAEAGR